MSKTVAKTTILLVLFLLMLFEEHSVIAVEEDVPKYGRAVGTGTLIIGVSLIAAFVTTFWSEKAMSFIVIPALVIGLGFILYAQFKYNKGIF